MEVSRHDQPAIRLLPGKCGPSFTSKYVKSRRAFHRTLVVSQTWYGCDSEDESCCYWRSGTTADVVIHCTR
jgi:hypothetical protein